MRRLPATIDGVVVSNREATWQAGMRWDSVVKIVYTEIWGNQAEMGNEDEMMSAGECGW